MCYQHNFYTFPFNPGSIDNELYAPTVFQWGQNYILFRKSWLKPPKAEMTLKTLLEITIGIFAV